MSPLLGANPGAEMRLSFDQSFSTPSRLTLFSILFSWANILHQLSYPEWIRVLHPLGWLLFLASVGLAMRPSSVRMFLAVLALRLAYTAYLMPMIRGHLFLEGLFALGIVVGLSMELRRLGKVTALTIDEQEKLFESFAPTLRVTCLLVYAAVVLSKLNSDFIDPQHSAAVQLLFWTSDYYPFIPTEPWAQQLSIWSTFAFEGGIPILLCFQRTRWFGVVAGLFFHTLLAFLPLRIASFTLTMCLLLFVWLPEDSPRLVYGSFHKICRACRVQPATLVVLVSLLAGATGLIFAGRNGFNLDMRALDMGMGMWWWQTAIMSAALWSVRNVEHDHAMSLLRVRSWTLRLVVGFVIFNILCPLHRAQDTKCALDALQSSYRERLLEPSFPTGASSRVWVSG